MTSDIEAKILEVWQREFDPKKNPSMPVTLFEDFKALITKEIKQAKIDGAKEYNRVLTDNLGKCEYTAIDDGVVGIYRQEIVGQAVRKANDKTIMSLSSPNGLNKD